MKVLLFTHEQDIDGMGSIVLSHYASFDFDYITCKTFEVNDKVKKVIDDQSIYNYDYIFVTDICIKEPLLKFINEDNLLKNKIQILDHHKSEIDEGNDKYPFVKIEVANAKGKVSGTSLYYDYLIKNNYLEKNDILDKYVEWTRAYDTWEWKKDNDLHGRMLHIIFETIGFQKYIEFAIELINNKLVFQDEYLKIIDAFNNKLNKDMKVILDDMRLYNLNINNQDYHIGYVKCPYKYRNDLNEYVMLDNKNNIDTLGMIMTDKETVSYRNIKDIDASIIGSYFGGKGHKTAASHPKDNELFKEVLKELYEN